ncbi:M14 family metallocarboxypeptidase [uncultured Paraglaciecola sp.]|uniref:M14 family metallopeptidase n=1 Tax=uncultured Paraglaciecola sp. TaxID=1765024 RepID=UPI0030DC3337|tara:strand:+ start:53917 stop:54834 length:918 start_codon:yes stop_codon:yes gene_type:complete
MTANNSYPIGQMGQKWQDAEKKQWLAAQNVKRSYADDVLSQLAPLTKHFDIEEYAKLEYASNAFPVFVLRSLNWDKSKPNILITGGVHGYETSGVFGALRFAVSAAQAYHHTFNIMIVPCVSPWAYETINRWNPLAIDPNRSFYANSPAQESAALMNLVSGLDFLMHIDLHETTDTDNSEFRPALAARDAVDHQEWAIPDGFYTVGDTENPCSDFQKAIIQSVEKVTHIAPADESGRIIGTKMEQKGVINYPLKKLSLCGGVTNARFVSTTEVYPDSPQVNAENCIQAQVAAITGALDFITKTEF